MTRHICMLTSVHPPGDPRILYREALTLVAAGSRVTLIAPAVGAVSEQQGVTIDRLPPVRRRWLRPLTWWRVLRRALAARADVYHFHDPELLPVGLLLKVLARKPVIYDVHEHNPAAIALREWIPGWLRGLAVTVFDHIERAAARWFDALIVADEAIADRFEHVERPVVTVFNYPARHIFEPGPPRPPDDLPAAHAVQIVYVGLLTTGRGGTLMLDALDVLLRTYQVDAGLWVIGRWSYATHEAAARQRLADNPQLADRVRYFGQIPHERVPALLRAATIGWVPFQPLPKLVKNIPTKLFEYMACGLPVVGSDLPPIRRYLIAEKAGLLASPADASSHADAISLLARDPTLAQDLGAAGRQAFLNTYNWDSEGRKLVALYRHLIGPEGMENKR